MMSIYYEIASYTFLQKLEQNSVVGVARKHAMFLVSVILTTFLVATGRRLVTFYVENSSRPKKRGLVKLVVKLHGLKRIK